MPAGTIAAVFTICPVTSSSVTTLGCGCPVGHRVRYPTGPGGTSVTVTEYACALEGIVQLPCSGKARADPAARLGGPNGLGNPCPVRVSTIRQGVIATKASAAVDECACAGFRTTWAAKAVPRRTINPRIIMLKLLLTRAYLPARLSTNFRSAAISACIARIVSWSFCTSFNSIGVSF